MSACEDEDATARTPLFRPEAIEQHAHRRHESDLLRLSRCWIRWSYWLLTASLTSALIYACVGTLHEYADGPAVVRVDEANDLTAVFAATVSSVEVRPGQHVSEGQPLVRFLAPEERGELDRLEKQLELELVRVMRDPSDQEARQSLTSLQAQRDLARVRVDERVVRAPRNGIVSDVRIRQGQHLAVGELILSIVGDGAPVSLIAVVPGRYRPSLHEGMPLRFELEGYRYEYQELVIDSISDAVIGPAEMRRYLGPEAADAMTLSGPLLLIRARLPARTFVVDGQKLAFFDGLPGRVSVRVRSEPILVALLPALKGLSSHVR